eukprot:GGOE01054512.1.p3 GENE.GGOE01054512.1~~GGOE01054512.1.p3  ORF type:complete len:107 (+),score=16.93 GGOE01054512.1:553-873(+)
MTYETTSWEPTSNTTCVPFQVGAEDVPIWERKSGSVSASAFLNTSVAPALSPRATSMMRWFAGMPQEVKLGLVAWISGWSQVVIRPVQILANVSMLSTRPVMPFRL